MKNYWKQLLTLLFLLTCTYSFSQEFYFTELGEATKNKEKANTILTLYKAKNKLLLNAFLMIDDKTAVKIGSKKARIVNDSTLKITVKKAGKVAYKMIRVYKKVDDTTYLVKDYDNYGNISFVGKASSFYPLVKNGWGAIFYDNGQVASTGIYNNNKLLENENWTSEGNKTFSNAYNVTTIKPSVKDSEENYIQALANHLQDNMTNSYDMYFDDQQNLFKRRNLNVNFIVDTKGNVEVTNIVGKFKNNFKNDVESAIAMTSGNWKPGYINNIAVNTKISLPLHIKAYNDYQERSSDHINHWFFYNDMPVRLYRW